ncbi:MAG: hypothetical protein UT42_C0024G0006 [Candidatus Falkowbacteria bacterium GW2011_GWA2_39_24]|uniref:Uncharacterized protein n=1 Tax=Candidatus Falkowbacteria bacterium GW2011_GWA2_39_24 TaxID=1618634 RepID=A0A0G0QW42_9BACT|nr:MAG: hypothetical protein UT42_C0024G0006 [Candidatus Falkowbacteria bacterium GW2011_GWA2_39_24]
MKDELFFVPNGLGGCSVSDSLEAIADWLDISMTDLPELTKDQIMELTSQSDVRAFMQTLMPGEVIDIPDYLCSGII